MANNRLYLKTLDGTKRILLAKYYPSTGWYMYHSEEELNEFFAGLGKETLFGSTDLVLEYETKDNQSIDEAKVRVLKDLQKVIREEA